MRWLAALAVVALFLSGCTRPSSTPPTDGNDHDVADVAYAPWWPVGAAWTMDVTHKGHSFRGLQLVNFWNDTQTTHFWLGVADKSIAFNHALNDTIPLLGRIHWHILTPHESGIHASGMYEFPIEDGDRFGGLLLGREWQVTTRRGTVPGSFEFDGTAPDGARLRYDYQPSLMWFSFLEIRGPGGTPETDIRVLEHKTGVRGEFHFYRGRDYYETSAANPPRGGQEFTFNVRHEDGRDPVALGVKVVGRTNGFLRVDVFDADGGLQWGRTLATTGSEPFWGRIDHPKVGDGWKIRYTGTGDFQGEIKIVGLLEFKATL